MHNFAEVNPLTFHLFSPKTGKIYPDYPPDTLSIRKQDGSAAMFYISEDRCVLEFIDYQIDRGVVNRPIVRDFLVYRGDAAVPDTLNIIFTTDYHWHFGLLRHCAVQELHTLTIRYNDSTYFDGKTDRVGDFTFVAGP